MSLRALKPSRLLMRMRRILRNDQLVLAVLAMVVGLAVGLLATAFRLFISAVQRGTFGYGDNYLSDHIEKLPWWQVVGIPTLGGILVGIIIHFTLPGRRPHGVADVVEAGIFKSRGIGLREGFFAALTSGLSIGVGASVGREGPAVHLGAAFAGWMARMLPMTRQLARTLLGCGVAAAVAASFNAPIAGALFAHEVIVGHYALTAFTPIVISSVTATMISRGFFGDFPAFWFPPYELQSFWEFPAFIGLGICCGLLAIFFVRSTIKVGDIAKRIPGPQWVRPGIAGAFVGCLALQFPEVLGIGYEATDLALKAQYTAALLLGLLLAKTAATVISLGLGFAGGVFSPSLVIGAMLGGVYGFGTMAYFPAISSGSGAYALIGMGGMASGVLGAPISTTLIVFEMTGDYGMTTAVMIVAVISSIIVRQSIGPNFFTAQLEARGIDIQHGWEKRLQESVCVADLMSRKAEIIQTGVHMPEIRKALVHSPLGTIFVVDEEGRYAGAVTLNDLDEAAFDPLMDSLIIARDVARTDHPTLLPEHTLDIAMAAFEKTDQPLVAVRDQLGGFEGIVRRKDILEAYNRAIVEAHREEH